MRPASPLVFRFTCSRHQKWFSEKCEKLVARLVKKSLSHWRPYKSQCCALLKGTFTTITNPKQDLIIKFYSSKRASTIPDIFMSPPPLPSLNHWTSLMAPNVCLLGKYFLKHIVCFFLMLNKRIRFTSQ